MLKEEQVQSQVLDHLGLVMATINKIGLIQQIDNHLPVSAEKGAKISMGERVAAMILNGLGFIDDRLYMFSEFLGNKPVERLFRSGVKASDFTDDALGRCLDEMYNYGLSKLFSEIAFEIGTEHKLLGKTARFDTTSLTVYGAYQGEEEEAEKEAGKEKKEAEAKEKANQPAKEEAYPKYGFSKDGRGDLKQMILNLATTGKGNLPIWMSSHSGNASDKVILEQAAERMKNFAAALKEAPSFLFVGDSAMYEKCVERAGDMLWLSRVPHVSRQAKEMLCEEEKNLEYVELDKEYRVSKSINKQYKGVEQRWVVVYSGQMYKREKHSLNKKIAQEEAKVSKQLWHLSNQIYSCKQDGHQAIKPINKGLKYHQLSYEVVGEHSYKQPGCPKAGANREVTGYKIQGTLTRNEEAIAKQEEGLGKFILATNQLDTNQLSPEAMLEEYKQQIHTERGFRFIKSDAFEVSSIFLKKASRIQALMMVMVLCLMVYNLAEYFLHQELRSKKASIANQVKKDTQTPSMGYIFRKFHGIQVVQVDFGSYNQELVINLTPILKMVVSCFGKVAEKIYGLAA